MKWIQPIIFCTWQHIFFAANLTRPMPGRGQCSKPRPTCRGQSGGRGKILHRVEVSLAQVQAENNWSFRPLQSRTLPTETFYATAVGSCVDFSCFSSCQLVNPMTHHWSLCWRGNSLRDWRSHLLNRDHARLSISKKSTRYHIFTGPLDVFDLSSCRNISKMERICSRCNSAPSLYMSYNPNPDPEPTHPELQMRLLFLLNYARWGSAPFGWRAWVTP